MTNKYPGQCSVCGSTVEPYQGDTERAGGRWIVTHQTCADGTTAVPGRRARRRDGSIVRPTPESTPEPERAQFPAIVALLEHAHAKGQQWPRVTFDLKLDGFEGRVRFQRNGEKSRYPGAVSITDGRPYGESTYYGRIAVDGSFYPGREVPPALQSFLVQFNEDPQGRASAYGRESGFCCFCHTEITHDSSTEVGYGPICADKFGLPHAGYSSREVEVTDELPPVVEDEPLVDSDNVFAIDGEAPGVGPYAIAAQKKEGRIIVAIDGEAFCFAHANEARSFAVKLLSAVDFLEEEGNERG